MNHSRVAIVVTTTAGLGALLTFLPTRARTRLSEAEIRADEALSIAAEIEAWRAIFIHQGDRRDDGEITGLYRAADIARQHARRAP